MAKLDEGERPRRFYTSASAGLVDGGFAVMLDGRVAGTPVGSRLILPTTALAERIASEWEAQVERIAFEAMPATRLAFTAIDRTRGARDEVAAEIARYAGSDLLCYLAQDPPVLVERELAAWGPWLDWAQTELGVALTTHVGIVTTTQDPQALARVEALAGGLNEFALSGLAFGAALYGSAILALAVAQGALDAARAFELSRIDEAFQEERWGVDGEAAERTEALRAEARMLGDWFAALT